jgi:hypothetical protein
MQQEENTMTRWRAMFRQERTASLRAGMTEDQANDRGQVAAWLDNMARTRRLRIERYIEDGMDRIVHHKISLLDKEDDETVCRGSLDMAKMVWGEDWPFRTDTLGDDWYQITLMINDELPEHAMFKRPDGSTVDLGFNGTNHQLCSFSIDVHTSDIVCDF